MYQYYKNGNGNNECSPATFYIKSDIKRFINDISIFKLPIEICNKEDNSEEDVRFN